MSELKETKRICAETRTGDNETTVIVSRDGSIYSVRFALRAEPLVVFTYHVSKDFFAAGTYDDILGGKYRVVTTHAVGTLGGEVA